MANGDNVATVQDCINLAGGSGYNVMYYDYDMTNNENLSVPYRFLSDFNLTLCKNAPSFSNNQLVPTKYIKPILTYTTKVNIKYVTCKYLAAPNNGSFDIISSSNKSKTIINTIEDSSSLESEYIISSQIKFANSSSEAYSMASSLSSYQHMLEQRGYCISIDLNSIHGIDSSESSVINYYLDKIDVSSLSTKICCWVNSYDNALPTEIWDDGGQTINWALVVNCSHGGSMEYPYSLPLPALTYEGESSGKTLSILILPAHSTLGYIATSTLLNNITIKLYFKLLNESAIYKPNTIGKTFIERITFKIT